MFFLRKVIIVFDGFYIVFWEYEINVSCYSIVSFEVFFLFSCKKYNFIRGKEF